MSKLKCEYCSKEFASKQALGGHIRQSHRGEGGKAKKERVGTKKEKYRIESSKSIRLSGRDLHLAEELINQGYAHSLTDLTHKSLNLFAAHALGEEGELIELLKALLSRTIDERDHYASLVAYKILS